MSAATGTFELFTSAVSAGDLRVVDWRCVESIGEPFRLELNARCAEAAAEEIVQALLGQPATFVMRTPAGGARARRGVVIEAQVNDPSSSDFAGSELGGGGRGSVRIVVAPRLALMAMKQHSRIFQGLTTEEIIRSVLEPWHLDARFQLAGSYQARAYCTQYRESDLAFLERICAREGFGFFLEHRAADDEERDSPGAETIVFHDEAHFYLEIPAPELGATGTVLEHATGRFGEAEHEIGSFGLNRTVRPELVRLGDFDFRRPGLALAAMSGLNEDERSPIGNELGGEQIAAYFHADRGELEGEGAATEIDEAVAKIRLEQLRQQAVTGRGRSRCQRLAPGYVFTLDRHPHGGLNGGYVVTRIEHRGRIPEATAEGEEHYDNHFSCVPSSTMWRPPAQSAPVQQAMETAVVVGPKDEEVHVDEHGCVKVQFHWQLEGKHDEHSSCWLRVTQPWAGANWGAQFLPRIGAEVLVGFVGGDVDRPIVMGSLYNGTRPTPFRLPAEINKAGFRSQSTPGGEGYSELTFDDQKGRERMILRAERHLEQRVGHDLQIDVGGTEKVTVTGKSERTIAGDMTTTVNGERKDELAKSYQVLVKGSHAVGIDGDAETRISGNRVTRIEGRDEIELAEAKATYLDSHINRVLGHLVTVVGQHDARKSATMHVEGSSSHSTTGTTEISSDKEIVLRVGDSSLRLTPEGIELVTKRVVLHGEEVQLEAKDTFAVFAEKQIALNAEQVTALGSEKVTLKGKEGQLTLDLNARLDGAEVKLNCSPEPVKEGAPPEYEPPKKTTISLSDEDGNPMPGRRYVVIFADGSERAGKLNEDGVAELYLEQGGKVVFPDVDNPRKA